MHILVIGTTVTAYGEQPPTGEGVPFEVSDFPGMQQGKVLHWDGSNWWYERDDYTTGGAVLATFTATPQLTAALTDADAAKMIPYLPEYDATRDHDAARSYQEGEICLRSGKPARRTSLGWREIGD